MGTNDRLPPKTMYSGSCDLFIFWEMTDNISEAVEDREVVAVED